tara:strand:+ start:487 stop:1650 length:1164 start_codon:yes stop_codon:yes gene_type:complete
MANWQPQLFLTEARNSCVPEQIINAAYYVGNSVIRVNSNLPPVFSLRHLSHLTDTDYPLLRSIVSREKEEPYRIFRIRKMPRPNGDLGFRTICVPDPSLLKVQRWINKNILHHAKSHSASMAYSPKSQLVNAARPHCNSRWIIKVDIRNFFESISEIAAYRVYLSLGYQPLVSFELARLSTRLGSNTPRRKHQQWVRFRPVKYYKIDAYYHNRLGHLPQGAPTSPILSNLAMYQVDEELAELALKKSLTYTRYADDMCFSSAAFSFSKSDAVSFISSVYKIIGRYGFSPNISKTRILTPGARKLVLGMLVDGDKPKLTRDFKSSMRMHLYYLESLHFGPIKHASNRGFSSVIGLKNHLFGLATYARQVEPNYGADLLRRLSTVNWPS